VEKEMTEAIVPRVLDQSLGFVGVKGLNLL